MGNKIIIQEVQTFKDFLEDKYSSDEIYFYLNCRYLLCNGPILFDSSSIFNVLNINLDTLLYKL